MVQSTQTAAVPGEAVAGCLGGCGWQMKGKREERVGMAIRCIALDMDRTTLNPAGRLSENNRAALERAIARGIAVVIASGRTFTSLPADVLAVPGIEYAITSNGAAVYHLPTGKCLHRFLLEPASVERVLALTAGEDVTYEGFVDGQAYAERSYVEHPERYGADGVL